MAAPGVEPGICSNQSKICCQPPLYNSGGGRCSGLEDLAHRPPYLAESVSPHGSRVFSLVCRSSMSSRAVLDHYTTSPVVLGGDCWVEIGIRKYKRLSRMRRVRQLSVVPVDDRPLQNCLPNFNGPFFLVTTTSQRFYEASLPVLRLLRLNVNIRYMSSRPLLFRILLHRCLCGQFSTAAAEGSL